MFKTDLKGPRYRAKGKQVLFGKEFKEFRKLHPQYKDKTDKELKATIFGYNEFLWRTSINYRDGVEFPEGLGYCLIATFKPTENKGTNYKLSQELGQEVRYRSFATDGYVPKIFYTNFASKYKFTFREVWSFLPYRDFRRTLAKVFPDKWKLYMVVPYFKGISDLYNKRRFRRMFLKRSERDATTVNEFAL